MPRRRVQGRRGIVVLAVVVGLMSWFAPVPAGATAGAEAGLLALTNDVRAGAGLPALVPHDGLAAVASVWASSMATAGALSHNGALPDEIGGWDDLGENVGRGASIEAVHQGFVASPTHYANIVDPAFTDVGFGVVPTADGRVYVVANFMRPTPVPAASVPPVPGTEVTASAQLPTATVAGPPADGLWATLVVEVLRALIACFVR